MACAQGAQGHIAQRCEARAASRAEARTERHARTAPRRHGRRHRRAHHPRAGRGARDAAPRLERQLAGHAHRAWRTSWCRRPASRSTPSASTGLRGKGLLHTAAGGLRLLKAFWECLAILRRRGADAVLGMGGYVCFPGGLMASAAGQAAGAGQRRRRAAAVQQGAAAGGRPRRLRLRRRRRAHASAVVTGNPVRAEIEPCRAGRAFRRPQRAAAPAGGRRQPGRQGAQRHLPAALALMRPAQRPRSRTRPAPRTSRRCARPTPASRRRRRGAALHRRHGGTPGRCDLMICRAGAVTVSELCAAGVPACWCR
jgi:UDP-N-acetylglucosamine--N-acetylmuramyl-(pentapeptide) pyrophosphoryl-undecaprenol N-acetylglucosamine transferase